MTPAAYGVRSALERGTKSEVAHKWARRLHNPCRLGGFPPYLVTSTAHRRSQSGGQNQKWPTSGQGGCMTPAA